VHFLFSPRNDAADPPGLILGPGEARFQRLNREADRRAARSAARALLARLRTPR
jgi:hypothetical protein